MKCEEKTGAYGSRHEALTALNAHRRAIKKWGHQQKGNGAKRVYRCEECGKWHLTSRRGRKKKAA